MTKEILKFNKFICTKRLRESSINRKRRIDQFYSDRSRIIFCSSFRRLQQKAQVFSLEPNASVRTRLTHSLEVSDLGRTLANKIGYTLENKKLLSKGNTSKLVSIIENACLLHDIGNPPFGHFGEAAIKDWAKKNIIEFIPYDLDSEVDYDNHCIKESSMLNKLVDDFREFDGNPQGFRIVTKLYTDYDKHSLNLTYSTLLSVLKYPKTTGEISKKCNYKKPGYFKTEKDIVEKIYEDMDLEIGKRFPFVYIMEAADDIAYCMSDIADGIEKKIITEKKFVDYFEQEWERNYKGEKIPVKIPREEDMKGFNQDISIPWSMKAMNEAVDTFISREKDIYEGEADSLISNKTQMGRVLKTIKNVSKQILYTSFEAESIEITGYAVIIGILNKYKSVFKMSFENFSKVLRNDDVDGFDIEKRLIHFIGNRYIKAYNYELENILGDDDFLIKEWWIRAHLIIDHISGMTDEYALESYQMMEGIKLMR